MSVPVNNEKEMLEGAVAILLTVVGQVTEYNFPPDASSVWLVDQPQIKHLGEFTTAYFVHPGDVIFTPDTGCTVRSAGDFLVTAVTRHEASELPSESGYEAATVKKLKMVADVMKALNGQSPADVLVLVSARNMSLEVDGWAVVQMQFAFEDSHAGSLG